jgi:hypothetical protein
VSRGDIAVVTIRPAPLVALTGANSLLRFDAATPASVVTPVAITGLGAGETVVGIDIRPATGELFAGGVTGPSGRVLRIDINTGAATAVGPAFSTTLPVGATYSLDFNPLVDGSRIWTVTRLSDGAVARVHGDTGVVLP